MSIVKRLIFLTQGNNRHTLNALKKLHHRKLSCFSFFFFFFFFFFVIVTLPLFLKLSGHIKTVLHKIFFIKFLPFSSFFVNFRKFLPQRSRNNTIKSLKIFKALMGLMKLNHCKHTMCIPR